MSPFTSLTALNRVAKLNLRESEDGQDLLEYGLLVALIALVAFGAVATVGQTVNTVFWQAIASAF